MTAHIGYHLRKVSNAVSHTFAQKLAANKVTVAEWVILRDMYATNTLSPSLVAAQTGLTRSAVSKLIDRLLQKGLVTRKESSGDRRYQDIELTPEAIKLVPKLASIADHHDTHFFSPLTPSEKKGLMDILKKLSDAHDLTTRPIE